MEPSDYHYQPIDLSKDSIRLVRLCSGFTDPIECELFQAFLHDTDGIIPYEALSYTWGGTEKHANIILDGCDYSVTENLYRALRDLRCHDRDRVLWIDAICIDQQNHRERMHQVGQMRLIYQQADEVVVWLGPVTEMTDKAMRFLQLIDHRISETMASPIKGLEFSNTAWQDDIDSTGKILAEILDLDRRVRVYTTVRDLLGSSWFRRAWIIQEIANARRATIMCGRQSVRARAVALAPKLLKMPINSHVQSILDVMPGFTRKTSWWSRTSERTLGLLLKKFAEAEATLALDQVYALLGMAPDARDVIKPDYNKTEGQVAQEVASLLVFGRVIDNSEFEFPIQALKRIVEHVESYVQKVLDMMIGSDLLLHKSNFGVENMPEKEDDPLASENLTLIQPINLLLLTDTTNTRDYRGASIQSSTLPLFESERSRAGVSSWKKIIFGITRTVTPLSDTRLWGDGSPLVAQISLVLAMEFGQRTVTKLLLGYCNANRHLGYVENAVWVAQYKQNLSMIRLFMAGANLGRSIPARTLDKQEAEWIFDQLIGSVSPLVNPREWQVLLPKIVPAMVHVAKIRILEYLLGFGISFERIRPFMHQKNWLEDSDEISSLLRISGCENSQIYHALKQSTHAAAASSTVNVDRDWAASNEFENSDHVSIWIKMKLPVNIRDETGRSALSWAAELGQLDNVSLWLSMWHPRMGPDVDNKSRSPLHWAVSRWTKSTVEIVRQLLQAGVDPKIQDSNGSTALEFAKVVEQVETYRLAKKTTKETSRWPPESKDDLGTVIRLLETA